MARIVAAGNVKGKQDARVTDHPAKRLEKIAYYMDVP